MVLVLKGKFMQTRIGAVKKLASQLICAVFFAFPAGGVAQQAVRQKPQGARPEKPIPEIQAAMPEIRAVKIEERIQIDGKLDEPAWKRAVPATNFIQSQPDEGQPATEETEVRILYDADNLYIGALCFEEHLDALVSAQLKRDFGPQDHDTFGIIIDAFNDQTSGLLFGINPAGAVTDTQSGNDGRTMNMDWDGVWYAKTGLVKEGWVAEFAIPFKTLRFKNPGNQVWGINFHRKIRHRNEDTFWSFVPRQYQIFRVSRAGKLVGLENIKQGRNLRVKPFVVGRVETLPSRTDKPHSYLGDVGLDVKYGVTPGLTLDFSANTDFSQVEVDDQQVNLTRFSLFFREKREFFLENSSIFQFGEGGVMGSSTGSDFILFFSRRIGLSETGIPIPILGGVRLSGSVGRYNLGLMDMQTQERAGNPANNFSVARVQRKFGLNNDIGAMFINRQAVSLSDNYNRTLGVDAHLRFFTNLTWTTYLAKTFTPGIPDKDMAWATGFDWKGRRYRYGAGYREVQENFNSEVGFIRRRGVRQINANFARYYFPEDFLRLREIRPNIDLLNITETDNTLQTRSVNAGVNFTFHDGSTIDVGPTFSQEVLDRDFQVHKDHVIPIGSYKWYGFEASYMGNRSRMFSANLSFARGGYYNGDQSSYGGGVNIRPGPQFELSMTVNRNNISLPTGTFGTNLMIWRVNYNFNTDLRLSALIQYNSVTQVVSSNIRFNFIHHPLSDLFVVYNENRDHVSGTLQDRAIILKFTHLISF